MAINKEAEIESIIKILEKRNAKLYHACQLKDFRSYVELGGVPSRAKLQSSGLDFTKFDTDSIDKHNNVWDKVFGNFSDFGRNFARENTKSQPNPYGPIQIVFNARALYAATDLSITLRSAGAKDFNRDQECLQSAQQFNLIFQHTDIDNTPDTQKNYIAFADTLNQRFNRKNCTSPEFNCTIENQILSFQNAAYIIVDSCIYKEKELIREVEQIAPKNCVNRTYQSEHKKSLIQELSALSATNDCTKQLLINGSFATRELKYWVNNCDEFHYNRFIRYLTDGTTRA